MTGWGRSFVLAVLGVSLSGVAWALPTATPAAAPAATLAPAAAKEVPTVATTPVPVALDQTTRISGYCTENFAREERTHGIPKHLLLAISSTESGRWNDKVGMVLPWPWTINADGKGYYFETKHDAVTAAHRLIEKGANNLDVGCMQISLKHHPKAFASLSEAFDPKKNVEYAAGFLRTIYEDTKSWTEAVGDYHSKTPSLGNEYFGMVKHNWKKIITALGNSSYASLPYLRFAGLSPELASVDLKDGYESEKGIPALGGGRSGSVKISQGDASVSIRRLPRMKVIKVTKLQDFADATPNSDDVLVVRPMKKNTEYEKPQILSARKTASMQSDSPVLTIRPKTGNAQTANAHVTPASATLEGSVNTSASKGPRVASPQHRGPAFIFD